MDKTGAILCRYCTTLIERFTEADLNAMEFMQALEALAGGFHYSLTIAMTLRDDASDLVESIRWSSRSYLESTSLYSESTSQIHKCLTTRQTERIMLCDAFWHLIFAIMEFPFRIERQGLPQFTNQHRLYGAERLEEFAYHLADILVDPDPTEPESEIILSTQLTVKKMLVPLVVGVLVAIGRNWSIQTARSNLPAVIAYVYMFASCGKKLGFREAAQLSCTPKGVEFTAMIIRLVENPNFIVAAASLKSALNSALSQVRVG